MKVEATLQVHRRRRQVRGEPGNFTEFFLLRQSARLTLPHGMYLDFFFPATWLLFFLKKSIRCPFFFFQDWRKKDVPRNRINDDFWKKKRVSSVLLSYFFVYSKKSSSVWKRSECEKWGRNRSVAHSTASRQPIRPYLVFFLPSYFGRWLKKKASFSFALSLPPDWEGSAKTEVKKKMKVGRMEAFRAELHHRPRSWRFI